VGTLNNIFNFISQLLNLHGGQFVAIGQSMYTGLATIMIVWFGVKAALSANERASGFHFARFAELVLMIAFGYGMINYYDTPIPGFGRSFYHLITDEAQYLTSLIGQTALDNAKSAIDAYWNQVPSPTVGNLTASLQYVLVLAIMSLWKFIAIAVNLFGPVAVAVAVLLGPIFIPFFIVPKLEWLFWGWLKFLIQYAFYQVIAAAVTFVMANLIVYALTSPPFVPIPSELGTLLGLVIILFLGGAYILLKVPAMTNHLFSGTSGLSTADLLGYLLP
jgi:TrbL/VirB6 plasmid conjugal transfer protein